MGWLVAGLSGSLNSLSHPRNSAPHSGHKHLTVAGAEGQPLGDLLAEGILSVGQGRRRRRQSRSRCRRRRGRGNAFNIIQRHSNNMPSLSAAENDDDDDDEDGTSLEM